MGSTNNYYLDPNPAVVNNFSLDPLSGYDFEVYVQNQQVADIAEESNAAVWIGKFQSLTLSVRNATETYLELGQRIPRYLDGEIQIAWVLEQGLVDGRFLQQTFGYCSLTRAELIGRMPRFQIVFDANAPVLNAHQTTVNANVDKQFPQFNRQPGVKRNANFQYQVTHCKVDNFSLGMMPGRRVVAQRWEGVAEGIQLRPEPSVQNFKQDPATGNFYPSFGAGAVT